MQSLVSNQRTLTAEEQQLHEDAHRQKNWKRWGPYLSERQWGTVREDYSSSGACWTYFPHDHARSRAYRWGEDGLLGWCDRECRLCFAIALWNGKDPILKERLFGLTNPEGNHGEDVKELYFYLDSTPTHSYCKALYKYPQAAFPYGQLVHENARRSRQQPEFELRDTGVFDESRYFDVFAEYAKASPDDTLIRITVANRGPEDAELHLLPTLWFRNSWTWGCTHEGCTLKPRLQKAGETSVVCDHESLQRFRFDVQKLNGKPPQLLFTDNETNIQRLFGAPNHSKFVKDAFHEYVIDGKTDAVNPREYGTKVAAWYQLNVPAGGEISLCLRLGDAAAAPADPFGEEFERIFEQRRREADDFYETHIHCGSGVEQRQVARQAYAGLLWGKQFYHYVVADWLDGDPNEPPPPPGHNTSRNADWRHVFARDIFSMPDKWEYPWFAAWDLAFHTVQLAYLDPEFSKEQLLLLLREWYTHPNGQLPAYEFAFGDVNPPVHAWACWRVYKITAAPGHRDTQFLQRAFQKLLINFTWWVNRKDIEGKHVFAGGFLGLDNIGLFDRSRPLPGGGRLEQADGTAWMAFYCGTMLSIALELAQTDPAYEDIASKFFEHFIAITDAINTLGGTGLWDELDGFYYDQLLMDGAVVPLRARSVVGVIPLLAVEILESENIDHLPGFKKRMNWFLRHRQDLARHISYMQKGSFEGHSHYLLAIPSRDRLVRVLKYVLDENEFLSPHGMRSLSRHYLDHPFSIRFDNQDYSIRYEPAESTTPTFGGNSNWRGPIWMPINFLLIEALERYHHFYGDDFQIECPTGSGKMMNLWQVAHELRQRLSALFLAGPDGRRPINGSDPLFQEPHFRNLVLFYEFFDGDNGRGCGASHQTGWTALVGRLIEDTGYRQTKAAQSAHGRRAAVVGSEK
ncbi:MAG TPA: hypothetical protein VN541_12865 [Tepidisphaeraceae bacterium]|nr:hypothetical protein [Tepidisphaeraceae bacterium]